MRQDKPFYAEAMNHLEEVFPRRSAREMNRDVSTAYRMDIAKVRRPAELSFRAKKRSRQGVVDYYVEANDPAGRVWRTTIYSQVLDRATGPFGATDVRGAAPAAHGRGVDSASWRYTQLRAQQLTDGRLLTGDWDYVGVRLDSPIWDLELDLKDTREERVLEQFYRDRRMDAARK